MLDMYLMGQNAQKGLNEFWSRFNRMSVTLEASVLDLYERRSEARIETPEDITSKIEFIRKACLDAQKQENNDISPQSWRRSGGSGNAWRSGSQKSYAYSKGAPQRQQQAPTAPAGRYVSRFQNTDTNNVGDKILNNIILSKLNKFSSVNYEEVKAFLQQILDSDEKAFLKDFMALVFKKAATESTFCGLYAKMLSELSTKYSVLREEMNTLYEQYLGVFEEVSESQCKDYETFVKRNSEKNYRLGYSQFLAELTMLDVLEVDELVKIYMKIITQIKTLSNQESEHTRLIEEYTDCLVRMTKAFEKRTNERLCVIRKELQTLVEPILTEVLGSRSTLYPGVSKKAGFAIMDCLDILRADA